MQFNFVRRLGGAALQFILRKRIMPKKYTIRDGFSFVGTDNKVISGGATITLDDDVAKLHAHKLEAVEEVEKKSKSKKEPDLTPPPPPAQTGTQENPDPAKQDGATGSDETGAQ